jgi:hypothetical protein
VICLLSEKLFETENKNREASSDVQWFKHAGAASLTEKRLVEKLVL